MSDTPAGQLLAVYFGSIERNTPRATDSLNHSMILGAGIMRYGLFINGTPRDGETRAGRLQLVNHGCEPGNNAVCEEWVCRATGLVAYFLRSKTVIRSRV
jgi:hypothetical protein